MFQRDTVQKLHRNESLAILLPDVVNRANIRMVQGGSSLRLALESRQRLSISGNFCGQELQSDETMEPGVFGFIDHTHPTAAELLQNAIVRDGLAEHRREPHPYGEHSSSLSGASQRTWPLNVHGARRTLLCAAAYPAPRGTVVQLTSFPDRE